MPKRRTTEEFMELAIEVHENKYTYNNVEYVNNHTKVSITCPTHGDFLMTPDKHLNRKQGCKDCYLDSLGGLERFIDKSNIIHEFKYDYREVNYVNNYTKVKIECPIHGFFFQTPTDHYRSKGCRECMLEDIRLSQKEFVERACIEHDNKYSYEKAKYVNSHTKITVTCPIHGDFEQLAANHLRGVGCKRCAGNMEKDTEEFIQDALKVHNDKYEYNKVEYKGNKCKVTIICNSCNKEFDQTPNNHLREHGCPHCKLKTQTKVYDILCTILSKDDIIVDKPWKEVMDTRKPDFRIDKLKLIIEYDGEQHFKQVSNWTGFEYNQLIDTYKMFKAKEAGYSTLRIPYTHSDPKYWLHEVKHYEKPTIIGIASSTGIYNSHLKLYHRYKNDIGKLVDHIKE